MLPSTNQVCRWLEQQSFCFKLEALSSRVQCNPLDRIHDENVASIGPQKLTNLIEISKKWHQLEIQKTRFRYGTIWRLNISKKIKSVSQKKKKVNIVFEQSSLPQIQLKMMEPNVYFWYETWFFHFFHGLFQGKISVYNSLHFELKNIVKSFVFLLGKSIFPMGYAFSCISIKK